MKKLMKLLGICALGITLFGCSADKTADENTYFDELNAAAKKSAEQKHFRVDQYVPEGTSMVCKDGKLKEEPMNESRTITDYDFENQQMITYNYVFQDTSKDAKDRDGFAIAYLQGKQVEKTFHESDGKRVFQKDIDTGFVVEMPTADEYKISVKDDERALYHITREKEEKGNVYTLTMKDPKAMTEHHKKLLKEAGGSYTSWNGCNLEKREEVALEWIYHVNADGYLTNFTYTTKRLLNDTTITEQGEVTYGTYETLETEPFE